jgi:hypothetical protein
LPKRTPSAPDVSGPSRPPEILQFKVWLLGISPMVWRRVQVPASMTLRELHGVIQVVMGWEGIHLFQFTLRARRFGSPELAARAPDIPLSELRLRLGTRFRYEYDLNGHGSTRCASRAGTRLTLRELIPVAWTGWILPAGGLRRSAGLSGSALDLDRSADQ